MRSLRIALAQINTTVGDLAGNQHKILDGIERARDVAADLVAFPELAIPGYPPEDLLLKTDFIEANLACLREIAQATRGITAVVGFADRTDDIFNAAAVLHDGELAGIYRKQFLPNYGVFDENRYFQVGTEVPVFILNDVVIGVTVCEDMWYPAGPAELQALAGGAEVLLNISSSPYYAGKGHFRERMLSTRASDNAAVVAYCNLVGGQDELVFDGHSLFFDADGELIARGAQFEEDFVVADVNADAVLRHRLHDPRRRKVARAVAIEEMAGRTGERAELPRLPGNSEPVRRIVLRPIPHPPAKPPLAPRPNGLFDRTTEVYHALILATRDYVRKNGFDSVVIGLSGGIDSSLTATIAADALGPDKVVGVGMPTRYSSSHSLEDAGQLTRNLGIRFMVIPIDNTFQAFLDMLAPVFEGCKPDVTEENIQPRIRGTLLMALSNKFGWLVLTTGNKSEIGVGYSTLYGDTAGGFAVLKDIPKVLVYELSRYRNTWPGGPVIPERVLTKAPSAELRPNQKDTDSLPPYEILDPILQAYVEEDQSAEEIVARGFDEATVRRVIRMVDRNEYKRRQSPPGVKITPRAFGKDRRLPITNRFHT
jgi:NAD+ synthase (glutamine-hydrolysing)